MSEPMKCEHCQKIGRRRAMRCCPDGWLYAEVRDDTMEGVGDEERVFIVAACSEECAKAVWRRGPGWLDGRESEPGHE